MLARSSSSNCPENATLVPGFTALFQLSLFANREPPTPCHDAGIDINPARRARILGFQHRRPVETLMSATSARVICCFIGAGSAAGAVPADYRASFADNAINWITGNPFHRFANHRPAHREVTNNCTSATVIP